MVGEATEIVWLWAALVAYAVATFIAIWIVAVPRVAEGAAGERAIGLERAILALLFVAAVLCTAAIAERWIRLGFSPFLTMFEVLLSQLWGVALIYGIFYWRMPALRASAVVVLPIVWVFGTWILMVDPAAAHYPTTYDTNWKWAHITMGKMFMATNLLALGLGGVIVMRRSPRLARWFTRMPADEVLDRVGWRLMMLALMFESLMLVAGAVWAQDAWGRYWAWDDLETSAFLNWIALAGALHIRLTYRIPYWVGALMMFGVFAFAFITFLGIPYISGAPHKGVV